jgi:hypothetical protein
VGGRSATTVIPTAVAMPGPASPSAAGLTLVILLSRALFNRRRFRGMVGLGTTGAVDERPNEDQRRAFDLIVEQRTADHDPETPDGTEGDPDRPARPYERRVD